ncbi:MAG TPA: 1-deoxy-D-xylulose-5-phosphate reductoisomerase [Lachnospiraceae bacterium]|nr:1-deoxy-D-xylulose-5-phosphate reductoisomerase [Lachnospiraceae bacterium]
MKNISILGSTGSIGVQTLEVVRATSDFRVLGLSTNGSIELLEEQIREFKPLKVAVMDEKKANMLIDKIKDLDVEVLTGLDGLVKIATMEKVDTVVMSVVGNIGIKPTYEAIRAKKEIALATKEVLVSGGSLIINEAKKQGVKIYPIDSEHSAIFQSLQGNDMNKIEKIILTASGGPFRGKTAEQLKDVTPEMALKHPNWSMGAKITIDSSTMMNKGLEVIEAKWLFDVDVNKIQVLVHPQSIVHSAVEYEDGAVMAQLGIPDMKVPISYALTYPKREKNLFEKLNLAKVGTLTFEEPDLKTFRCLALAYKAIEVGGSMPAVLNAANEIAVEKFLNKEIKYLDIPTIIETTMTAYTVKYNFTIEELLETDEWGRKYAQNIEL